MTKHISLLLCLVSFLPVSAQQSQERIAARQAFEHKDYSAASAQFGLLLSEEPDDIEVLSGLVDSLEALGEWKIALQPLRHLVSLLPSSAKRANQLGLWETWSGNKEGMGWLEKACGMEPFQAQYCADYAEVLSWHPETRRQAIAEFRAVLTDSPDFLPAITGLAEIFSWDRKTRNESSALYDRALRIRPTDIHVLAGKAQLLAYSGRFKEATEMYDRALELKSNDSAALAGKAQLLNWEGDFDAAHELLLRAQRNFPNDRSILAEMVRTEIGLHNYSGARRSLLSSSPGNDLAEVKQDLDRATSPWIEFGYESRHNPRNLQFERATAAASAPLGSRNRLLLHYLPTLLDSDGTNFNANYFAAEVNSVLSDHLTLTTMAGSQTYPGFSPEITAGIQGDYQGRRVQLGLGFHRATIDDTLVSLRGIKTGGVLTGQVTSNLASARIGFRSRAHGLDGSISSSAGIYSGTNLKDNRRWFVAGNFGKQVRSAPYLRLQYGVSYSEFQYDANAPVPQHEEAGGYFSPRRYLLNYGGLTFSHHANTRLELEATGTAGAQNVANSSSRFSDESFAGSFTGALLYRPTSRDEFRIQYNYLDVFNAFHRHIPSVTWRHYF